MNSPSSEHHVQQILANSHPSFYPPSSIWMKCNNYTFLPHSNECGIRTLLALIFQALHPDPHPNILLPYMHSNLAQIGRTWVAASLITSHVSQDSIQEILSMTTTNTLDLSNATSNPFSLIEWTTHLNQSDTVVTTNSVHRKSSSPLNAPYGKIAPLPSSQVLNPNASCFYPRSNSNGFRQEHLLHAPSMLKAPSPKKINHPPSSKARNPKATFYP